MRALRKAGDLVLFALMCSSLVSAGLPNHFRPRQDLNGTFTVPIPATFLNETASDDVGKQNLPPNTAHSVEGTIYLTFRYFSKVWKPVFEKPVLAAQDAIEKSIVKHGRDVAADSPFTQYSSLGSCLYIAPRPMLNLLKWGQLEQVIDILIMDLLDQSFYYSFYFTIRDDTVGIVGDGGLTFGRQCMAPNLPTVS